MNPRLAHLLVHLYPRPWQARYGPEFQALLEATPASFSAAINIIRSALSEHVFPTRKGPPMNHNPHSLAALIRQPSAFLPLAMSITALTLVLANVAIYGAVREVDEGATAHLWQILMAAQIPVIAFFTIKSLRQAPRPAVKVVALQAGAVLANIAAVFFFNLG